MVHRFRRPVSTEVGLSEGPSPILGLPLRRDGSLGGSPFGCGILMADGESWRSGHGRSVQPRVARPTARVVQWSWRESNPRPPSGRRPRYDHSRDHATSAGAPPGRGNTQRCSPPSLSSMPAVFPAVSGLSLRSATASVAGLQRPGPVCRHRSLVLSTT